MINLKTECEGWFSLSTFKVDDKGQEIPGSRREPVPPFKNLILDRGLDRMGNNVDWLTWCQVGAGSTVPALGDTALASRIAGSNVVQASNIAAQSSAPFYVARTKTFRFTTGSAAGNLSEVGIGWATSGSLFSRALILDALGAPTTITVLSDEQLDVTYQFRQYMPAVDGGGSITLRGVNHLFVSRAARVTVTSGSGWLIESGGSSAGATSLSITQAYTGSIGAVTADAPSGTAMPATSVIAQAYSASSLQRDISVFFGNNNGNDPLGIGAIQVRLGIGIYQFGFTPNIMKTSDDTLSLTLRHSWSRKAL